MEGMDFEDFLADEKTRYSVICALENRRRSGQESAHLHQATESSGALEGYGRNERSAYPRIFWD